jgi:Protein of unknown function (DUF992)
MRGAKRGAWTAVGTALAILLVAPNEKVQAQARVEVGVLTCTAHGGSSFLVTSTKDLRCRFHRAGRDEFYRGTISKFGVDVGATQVTSIAWAVLAPTSKLPRSSLSGTYGGVGAEATVGVGVGANALVGGSTGGIILQPLSVQAQQGLNVAAGVESLQLLQARE